MWNSAPAATLTDKAVSFSSIVVPVDATAGKDMQAVFTIDGKQRNSPSRPERNGNALTVISTTSYWGITGLVIGGADGSGVTIEPWTDDVKGEIQLVPVI